MSGRLPAFVVPLAVAAVAVAVQCAGALPGDLIWDDRQMLLESDLYTNPARLGVALSRPLGLETGYWRPAATTSYLLETIAHGGVAWGYRLTSALLHGASAALVAVLLRRLLGSAWGAGLAALAWALHPLSVEPVTWVAGRFDVLAGLFSFATLVLLPAEGLRGGRLRVFAAGLAAALALLSKESAIVLPFAVIAWHLAAGPPQRLTATVLVARVRGVAPVLIAFVAALLLRFERLGFLLRTGPADTGTLGEHVLLIGRASATYAHVFLLPWTAGPAHRAEQPIPAGDPLGWTGLVLLACVIAATIWLVRRRAREGWLLAGGLLTLAPVLQFVQIGLAGELHAADRFLYVPSFFFVAAAASGVGRVLRAGAPSRARVVVAAVCLFALAGARMAALAPYESRTAFWRTFERLAPGSLLAADLHTRALLEDGYPGGDRLIEAARRVDRRTAMRRDWPAAVVGAEILLADRRGARALRRIEAALEGDPTAPPLLLMQGRLLVLGGEPREAAASFAAAARRGEELEGWWVTYLAESLAGGAETAALLGEGVAGARRDLARAAALPGARRPAACLARARAWLTLGEPEQALEAVGVDGRNVAPATWNEILEVVALWQVDPAPFLLRAERAGVPFVETQRSLAYGCVAGERWREAVPYHERVAELSGAASALVDLGHARRRAGDTQGAERDLRSALARDPGQIVGRAHLGDLLRSTGRKEQGEAELARALADARAAADPRVLEIVRNLAAE